MSNHHGHPVYVGELWTPIVDFQAYLHDIVLLPDGVADVDVKELGVVAVHGGDGGGATVPLRVDLRGGLPAVEPVLDPGPEDEKLAMKPLLP